MIFKLKPKKHGIFLIFLVVITILVFSFVSPKNTHIKSTNTITSAEAENLIKEEFNKNWKDTIDGCGLIKILDLQKKDNGYTATIEYGCGVVDPSKPNPKKEIFIDQSGKVTGIPKPHSQ